MAIWLPLLVRLERYDRVKSFFLDLGDVNTHAHTKKTSSFYLLTQNMKCKHANMRMVTFIFVTFEANNSSVLSLHRAHMPSRHAFGRNPCSFLAQSVYLAHRRNLEQFKIGIDVAVTDVLTHLGCAECRMRSARVGRGTDPRCKSHHNLDGTPAVPKKTGVKMHTFTCALYSQMHSHTHYAWPEARTSDWCGITYRRRSRGKEWVGADLQTLTHTRKKKLHARTHL